MNIVFAIVSMLGGLALFLFGMNFMSAGLEKLAGGKLEHTLEMLTNNKINAVLLGAGVTAIIQSSSATTVMVVGFVNSGIMRLSQSIGVMMGANIGTTVTAWILSLTGLKGDNLIVKILNSEFFCNILALVGVIFYMFLRQGKKRDIGAIILGFCILMTGMSSMSSAVEPLATSPAFQKALLWFNNPVLGLIVGMVITAIIQSSSASVGILQAMSISGRITFGMAVPIILGQNIGATIAAIISCIGARKKAKAAALINVYTKVFGVIIFSVSALAINTIFHFDFFTRTATPVTIATIHTTFNILMTVTLLPFTETIKRLALKTLRDTDDEKTPPLLDVRFLDKPTFAIEQCKNVMTQMADLTIDMTIQALSLLDKYDTSVAQAVSEKEEKIDRYEDILGTYLVKLSANNVSEADSHEISKMLHVIGDLERIGDHALNISTGAKEMKDKNISFSSIARKEILVMSRALTDIVSLTITCLKNNDTVGAQKVEPLEQVVDGLKKELKNRHIQRLQHGSCTVELGFVYSDLLTNFERISDHCSNIAVCVIRIRSAALDAHEYLNELKNADEGAFADWLAYYQKCYSVSDNAICVDAEQPDYNEMISAEKQTLVTSINIHIGNCETNL